MLLKPSIGLIGFASSCSPAEDLLLNRVRPLRHVKGSQPHRRMRGHVASGLL
jgi:hypothetical protein